MKILWAILLLVIPLGGSIWLVAHMVRKKKQQFEKKQQQEKDYQLALERARESEREERFQRALGGHVPTMLSLAKEYETANLPEAIKWYDAAAALGNDIAQRALSRLCKLDREDPQGDARSLYWQAVVGHNEKDVEQTHQMAKCLFDGQGVDQDEALAVELMTQAAEKQHIPSQTYLGEWYKEGDPARALMWWQRAAIKHDLSAQLSTALCYQSGIGTEKNRNRAVYWLERAAEQGDNTAQFLAGKLHLGRTADDAAVAYIWFSIAAANGHSQAQGYRKDVLPQVASDFLQQTQGIARQVFAIINEMGDEEEPGNAIALLDRVYSRVGYFPTNAQLASLAEEDIDMYVAERASTLEVSDRLTAEPTSMGNEPVAEQVDQTRSSDYTPVDNVQFGYEKY